MSTVNFDNLLGTGAHFGHVTRNWHPNFAPYILMEKNGVHIINLEETLRGLEKAIDFVQEIIRNNGEILFVGTKKQAQDIIQQEADRCGMFYVVERWLGGTLTNFSTIKKSIKRLQMLEKEGSKIYQDLTKKEIQKLNRERIKLADQHRGIKDMKRLPDAVVVVDAHYEATAVKEASSLEIPIIAIVDSNTDPTPITYPIPANDDSIRTIQLIISALTDAILETMHKGSGAAAETLEEEPPVSSPTEEEKTPPAEDSRAGEATESTAEEAEATSPEVTDKSEASPPESKEAQEAVEKREEPVEQEDK